MSDIWETKAGIRAGRGKFDPQMHPRDHKGRFIEKGAIVRLWGGAQGKVVKNVGGGLVEIDMLDQQGKPTGALRRVKGQQMEVVKRPDGSAPSGDAKAKPKAMQVEAPDPSAQDFTADAPANRVPAKDLRQGQAVLVYGRDADGNAVQSIGIVDSVEDAGAGDLLVRMNGREVYTDADALARPLPAEKFQQLRDAITRGDNATAKALQGDILREVVKADQEFVAPRTPDAGEPDAAAGASAGAPITRRSTKPLKPNTWGSMGAAPAGSVNYHEDGVIGRAVAAMGDDAMLDVDGEPLANVLGVLATDAVTGRSTTQEMVDRVKAIRDRLPEGGRARRALDDAIGELDTPQGGAGPDVPDSAPEPLRTLAAALNGVPAARQEPGLELEPLAEILDEFDQGKLSAMRLISRVRGLRNHRHESAEGKAEIDRAVDKAVNDLTGLSRTNREALRPDYNREQARNRQQAAPEPAPTPAANAPAAPAAATRQGDTVTPTDLTPGDRVSFTVPVTRDNAARFEGGKNPPKPGQDVTIRGTVDLVQDEMFGGQTVRLRPQGAQWQSQGGGGALVGDALDWPLDEDHQVVMTGRAEGTPQRPAGSPAPQARPQVGLFSDVGKDESGTEDMFTAMERDDEPAPTPKPAPARTPAAKPAPKPKADQHASARKPAPKAVPKGKPSPEEVEARIRHAHAETANASKQALLSHLRDHPALAGLSREDVDAGLKRLASGGNDGRLFPHNYPQQMTDRDRAGAIRWGDQDKHSLWLDTEPVNGQAVSEHPDDPTNRYLRAMGQRDLRQTREARGLPEPPPMRVTPFPADVAPEPMPEPEPTPEPERLAEPPKVSATRNGDRIAYTVEYDGKKYTKRTSSGDRLTSAAIMERQDGRRFVAWGDSPDSAQANARQTDPNARLLESVELEQPPGREDLPEGMKYADQLQAGDYVDDYPNPARITNVERTGDGVRITTESGDSVDLHPDDKIQTAAAPSPMAAPEDAAQAPETSEANAPEADPMTPQPGVFTPEQEQRINAAVDAFRQGLTGDDEMGMMRPFADLRDLLDETSRGSTFNTPPYDEAERLRQAATEQRDAWDRAHAEQIREQRRRRENAMNAALEAEKTARAGDLDAALAKVAQAEQDAPDARNWDAVRADVHAEYDKGVKDRTPLPSTDDGNPPSPDGMTPARRAKLVASIEENAAGFAWTNDPGRYIAESAGDQGRTVDGEKEWIDAYIAAHPEVLDFSQEERDRRKRQREARQKDDEGQAVDLSVQAKERFDGGEYDQALELIDQAEALSPYARNWDAIRGKIREEQAKSPAPQEPASQAPEEAPSAPDNAPEPSIPEEAEAPQEAPSAPDEAAGGAAELVQGGMVDAQDLHPGDRITVVREPGGVRGGPGAQQMAVRDQVVWTGTVPADYTPGQPVRLLDVVEREGTHPPRHVPNPDLVRLDDQVDRMDDARAAVDAAQAAALRDAHELARDTNTAEAEDRKRQLLTDAGGDHLERAVAAFDEAAGAVFAGERPVGDAEAAWVEADAALAAALETAPDWIRQAQLKTMRTTLGAKLGRAGGDPGRARREHAARLQAAQEKAARAAEDGTPGQGTVDTLTAGDRIDTPDGADTVTVQDVTRVGDVTFTTTRAADDRKAIIASQPGAPVTKRSGGRKPMTLEDGVEVGDLNEGEWLMVDGVPMRIAGIERDGAWAKLFVAEPDGGARQLDYRNDETVTRALNVRKRRPTQTAQPRQARARRPAALDDGTPAARVRLRSDIRKRVLDLGLDSPDSNAPEEVQAAAARLRASQPLSAAQMRALGSHLRGMAADESLPGATRRSLGRAGQWVDASYARLSGYPRPPHNRQRDTLTKAYAENLAEGDTIALAEADGSVTQARVTGVRALKGFPIVNVAVEHHDGRREERVLAAGVDVWVMPDLPDDAEVTPVGPVRREHITPDRVEVGDLIAHPIPGSTDPTPRVMAISKTSREFSATDTWRVHLAAADGRADVVTLTSQGYPSVVRTERGPLSQPQAWDNVLPDIPGEPIEAAQVERGDRVRIRRAGGAEVEGTVEHLAPITDGTRTVGTAATVRTLADTTELVPLFDGDATQVTRLVPAADNVRAGIDTVMRRRAARTKQRQVMAALADAETGLYRSAAGSILAELDTKLVHPPEGDGSSGMDVWATAGDVVEAAWRRLDVDQAAERVVDALGVDDDTQRDTMLKRVRPLITQIHEQAADNMIASIVEIDPLPGETHDQALRDMLTQFRDMPPLYAHVGRDLAAYFDLAETTEVDAPQVPTVEGGDLGARMAAYRQALPPDLGNLGRRQVNRPVFKPLSLDDLNEHYAPELDTVTGWVPDTAADGGPGDHAMRHLAVVKAAGADLDAELSRRLDADESYQAAVAKAATAREAVTKAEQRIADKQTAGKKPTAKDTTTLEVARTARDTADEQVLTARREALLGLLGEVRGFGGVDLPLRRAGNTPAGDGGSDAGAIRDAQALYPADWLALLAQRGPITLRPGDRGGYDGDAHAIVFHPGDRREHQRIAAHEIAHAMEKAVPGLAEAQEAYLWERSSHGDVGDRTRTTPSVIDGREQQVGYPDAFRQEYTGRVYPTGNREILATGMEDLMSGGDYLDDDFRAWLLGSLALLGTDARGPQRDPLDGANLAGMTPDELRAMLDRLDWGSPAYQRVMAELANRDHDNDPLDGLDLDTMELGDLVELMGRVDDPYSLARLSDAADRREQADREQETRDAKIDELVAGGTHSWAQAWAEVNGVSEESLARQERAARFGSDRRPGETADQMVDRHYRDWQEAQWLAAEAATNGYMLNREGRAAGVDPRSLFQGSYERARKYASDELRAWWDDHGWMNKTEFRAQMLGRDRDVRAAKTSKEGRR